MAGLILLIWLNASCIAGTVSVQESVLPESDIRRVIEEFVLRRTANLGVQVNLKKVSYSGDVRLPAGNPEYEIVAPRQWEGWGTANLALIVRIDGQVKRNIPIKVEVEALAEMVVTVRQLEQGHKVVIGDVALQKRNLATAGDNPCRNIDDVIGKRLKRTVRGNMLLTSNLLEKIPIVKYGQIVTIVLENDILKITAKGRVKGAGAAGDMILVQNLSSQKDIQARVVDQGTVRVEY